MKKERSGERRLPARYQSHWPGGSTRLYPTVRQRVIDLRRRGVKVGTCVPVLCEIEAGIQQIKQPEVYRANLDRLLRQISIWPVLASTAKLYGRIHRVLRLRGRVLSQVDIMLAALALEMDLVLATSDLDFAALADVKTVNWVPIA